MTNRKTLNIKTPEADLLAQQYHFVQDTVLRANIVITLQYITFLYEFKEGYDVPGINRALLLKDIIIHITSVVECVLNYTLQQLCNTNPLLAEKAFGDEKRWGKPRTLLEIDDNRSVVLLHRERNEINNKTSLNKLIYAAKRLYIFDSELAKRMENVMHDRNRLHLIGLSSVDNQYTDTTVDAILSDCHNAIFICKHKLSATQDQ